MKTKKAIVIGSGIGGISTAIRLANLGYKVTVFEAANKIGGKLAQIESNGFRWDKGPSVFTLPHLLDELFLENNKNPKDYYSYEKLEVVTKYFFSDKTILNAYSDTNRFKKEFEKQLGEPISNVQKFLKDVKEMFDLTNDIFLNNSLRHFYRTTTWRDISLLFKVNKLKSFWTMNTIQKKYFTTKKAQQFFNRFATYNGSNPYKAPATINMIAHLEHNLGAFYMKGGMYTITSSLEKLAVEKGVNFICNAPVKKIIVENKTAVGVLVNEETIKADCIVSNADVYKTYTNLLKSEKAPKKILNHEKSSSALIFYWAMNKSFQELDMHNVFFSENDEEEFKKIALGKVHNDFTIYIYISNKKNKNDAPAGCENWFVMINVPNNQGQDWSKITNEVRSQIIQKLSTYLKTKIQDYILEESILDPIEIERLTSSHLGALYGNSSNNMFSAFLRHPNNSNKIKNLYFVGGSVHPGGGVPLCILSSKIATNLICYDQKSN